MPPSFFDDVNHYFDAASRHTDVPGDILEQIRAVNAVYRMRFPVRFSRLPAVELTLLDTIPTLTLNTP